MMALPNPPAFIEYTAGPAPLRFLVFDAPNDTNLPAYINEFKRYHVKHVVRVCDPTYSSSPLEDLGIKVHDWAFPDGNSPPKEVLHNWTKLVRDTFANDTGKTAVGVHCVAGLGRAPVLVAVALIEAGLDPLAAVQFVRQRRPGAINASQLRFIKEYKPQKKENCLIM